MASWWAGKVRQAVAHLRARVGAMERAGLATWLTAEQLAVFDSMHVADRRHGLDVVATLRATGETDRAVLLAGLLHDAGKGAVGFLPRVAYSLGQAYGPSVWRSASRIPGWATQLEQLRDHAERSAVLAAEAGCSVRTVELIRHQDDPVDPDAGRRLQLADDAN